MENGIVFAPGIVLLVAVTFLVLVLVLSWSLVQAILKNKTRNNNDRQIDSDKKESIEKHGDFIVDIAFEYIVDGLSIVFEKSGEIWYSSLEIGKVQTYTNIQGPNLKHVMMATLVKTDISQKQSVFNLPELHVLNA